MSQYLTFAVILSLNIRNKLKQYLSLLDVRRCPHGARGGGRDEADVVELEPRRLGPRTLPLGRPGCFASCRIARGNVVDGAGFLDALLTDLGSAIAARNIFFVS